MDDGSCMFPDFAGLLRQVDYLEGNKLLLLQRLNGSELARNQATADLAACREAAALAQTRHDATVRNLLQTVDTLNATCGPNAHLVAARLQAAEARASYLEGVVANLNASLGASVASAEDARAALDVAESRLERAEDQVALLNHTVQDQIEAIGKLQSNDTKLQGDILALNTALQVEHARAE